MLPKPLQPWLSKKNWTCSTDNKKRILSKVTNKSKIRMWFKSQSLMHQYWLMWLICSQICSNIRLMNKKDLRLLPYSLTCLSIPKKVMTCFCSSTGLKPWNSLYSLHQKRFCKFVNLKRLLKFAKNYYHPQKMNKELFLWEIWWFRSLPKYSPELIQLFSCVLFRRSTKAECHQFCKLWYSFSQDLSRQTQKKS